MWLATATGSLLLQGLRCGIRHSRSRRSKLPAACRSEGLAGVLTAYRQHPTPVPSQRRPFRQMQISQTAFSAGSQLSPASTRSLSRRSRMTSRSKPICKRSKRGSQARAISGMRWRCTTPGVIRDTFLSCAVGQITGISSTSQEFSSRARAGKPAAGFFNRTAARISGRTIFPSSALSPGVSQRAADRAFTTAYDLFGKPLHTPGSSRRAMLFRNLRYHSRHARTGRRAAWARSTPARGPSRRFMRIAPGGIRFAPEMTV